MESQKMPKGAKIAAGIGIAVIIICVIIIISAFSKMSKKNQYDSSSSSKDQYGHSEYIAMSVAKEIVESKLKAPSTAKFCSTREATITVSGNTWTVKGWVDAQNSFGATIRNTFTVKFTFTGRENYRIDSCVIN